MQLGVPTSYSHTIYAYITLVHFAPRKRKYTWTGTAHDYNDDLSHINLGSFVDVCCVLRVERTGEEIVKRLYLIFCLHIIPVYVYLHRAHQVCTTVTLQSS